MLEHVPVVAVAVALPSAGERAAMWSAALGGADVRDRDVSAAYRLTMGRIGEGAELAISAALADGRAEVSRVDVELGARAASVSNLGDLAITMPGDIGWDDLVLPDRPMVLLRSLTAFMRHRDLVLEQWGFGRRSGRAQGLVAMFAGDSGTGKTLAARVLAADLGLELFRIDLATVVSKWLGETEKNLDRMFAAAQGANAVLFFDEADAVFGRRSDVQDSHDRYANLQTSYLLQRIEQHDGPVILATNMRGNIDDAFLRRMDAVIEFPFPDRRAPPPAVGAAAAAARRRAATTSSSTSSPSASSCRAAGSATPRSPAPCWPRRTAPRSAWSSSCAASRWNTPSSAG